MKNNKLNIKPLFDWIAYLCLGLLLLAVVITHITLATNSLWTNKLTSAFLGWLVILMIAFLYVLFSRRYHRRKWAKALRKNGHYNVNKWEVKLIDRFYKNAIYDLHSIQYATLRLNILISLILAPATLYALVCVIVYASLQNNIQNVQSNTQVYLNWLMI